MGLVHGCSTKADELFAKRINTSKITKMEKPTSIVHFTIEESQIVISPVYGDCTACSVYLESMYLCHIQKTFKILQEYMSINARISCFFSLKKCKRDIPAWLKQINMFPIAGLHIQKSNREPDSDYYMITGILKVPTPIINTYDMFQQEYPENHNNNDVTKINQLNTKFKLQTF